MENSVKNDELMMEAGQAFEKQLEDSADVVSEVKSEANVSLVEEEEEAPISEMEIKEAMEEAPISEMEIMEAIEEADQEEKSVMEKSPTYDVGELRLRVRGLIKKMIEDEFSKMIKKLGLEE